MKNTIKENLKPLSKEAVLHDAKTKDVKSTTGGIMDKWLKHFQDIFAMKGITNINSMFIYSADLPCYWNPETKTFMKCSRNPETSEKGQHDRNGKPILYNKNAVDRTIEPVTRRKVKNFITNAEKYNVDWEKAKTAKALKEANAVAKELLNQPSKDRALCDEQVNNIVEYVKNCPESELKNLLSRLKTANINIHTKNATRMTTRATKKVA